jgi:hypothetical protein
MRLTNRFNLPQSFFDVIQSLNYDITENDPNRIGVTTLIKPPRISILTKKYWNLLEEDVSERIWLIMGNACHYILEKAKNEHRATEEKIEIIVDGITLVAKPDIYDSKHKCIEDWKITSVWSFMFGDKIDWEQQFNTYAWMLKMKGFEVNKIQANALLRDWNKNEAKKSQGYPQIPFQVREVRLWSFEEQDKFVKDRIALYKSCMGLEDDKLPLCTREERWARDDSFAVYSNENKTATRVLGTEEEAQNYILESGNKKNKYRIEKRLGKDIRCLDYCSVNRYCQYYLETYESGVIL